MAKTVEHLAIEELGTFLLKRPKTELIFLDKNTIKMNDCFITVSLKGDNMPANKTVITGLMTAAFRPGVQVRSNSAHVLFLFHSIKISAVGNFNGDSKTVLQCNLQ